ncbi:MAG: indole-3-glycerol-phosphate synthase TrpC, partial [Sphingomonadales bacterium]|nr:indole-3-glycerol-phosphate synthase TrpC [Sphingomonadales bacterium]
TEYGMDVLVEVHDEAELDRAVGLGATLIGVNNRDLATFETDLAISERLSERAPPGCLLVSESGIADHADIARLSRRGITAFLVGESLMRQRDVGAALRRLIADDGAPGAA